MTKPVSEMSDAEVCLELGVARIDELSIQPIFRTEIRGVWSSLNDKCRGDSAKFELLRILESGPAAQARAILEVRRVKS